MSEVTGTISMVRCKDCKEFPNDRSSGVSFDLNGFEDPYYYCQCGALIILNESANWETCKL